MTTHVLITCKKPNHKRVRVQRVWVDEKTGEQSKMNDVITLEHGESIDFYIYGQSQLLISEVD